MKIETERKFLLSGDGWKEGATAIHFKQAYVNEPGENTVRVRIEGERGVLTIKSKTKGISRQEYEYEIPLEDAEGLLKICRTPVVEKYRYKVKYAGHLWEIDEFVGTNAGLVMAEIELSSEDEYFEKPEWIGEEVTADKRYYNSHLARYPYSQWK